jgi:hypothetical protein
MHYTGSDPERRMGTDQTNTGDLGRAEYKEINDQIIKDFEAEHGRLPEDHEVQLFDDVRWQGGHLVATAVGGPGERINIIPMLESLNQFEKNGSPLTNFRSLEHELNKLLDRPDPHKVHLTIDVDYPPGRATPTTVRVKFDINDQFKGRHSYHNMPPYK